MMTRPQTFCEIAHSDPTLAALRTLRDRYKRREITRQEYERQFATLNNQAGQPCDECGLRIAVFVIGRRNLCGVCGLKARGI